MSTMNQFSRYIRATIMLQSFNVHNVTDLVRCSKNNNETADINNISFLVSCSYNNNATANVNNESVPINAIFVNH